MKLLRWLADHRTSVRVAFAFRVITMALNAALSLVWTRLLVGAMGRELYGLLLAFGSVVRLAGAGDLGIGGAVGLKTGTLLGAGREEELRSFLAAARGLFLLLTFVIGLTLCLLAPWLPGWLGFEPAPGAGPLTPLFLVGAGCVAVSVFGSYLLNVNYAFGSVMWPVLPSFLLLHAGQLAHWLLARAGQPLWVQSIPQLVAALLTIWMTWGMLRIAHSWLHELWPIRFDGAVARTLLVSSGWLYLSSLGSVLYHTTDRLLVNAGFGAAALTPYQLNYKIPELAVQVILTASFVSLPKLTLWLSGDAPDRHRAIAEAHRMNILQIFFGCTAALGYLVINDRFIDLWLGGGFNVPLLLQFAFATNLVITTGCDACIQLASRCGDRGLRWTGLCIGGAGLLNLFLSWLAMRAEWLAGIAFATTLSQAIVGLALSRIVANHLAQPWHRWILRGIALPLAVVALGGAARVWLPGNDFTSLAVLAVLCTALLAATGATLGLGPRMLREEFTVLRKILRG